MLKVFFIVTGHEYQMAAAWSAATFAMNAGSNAAVTVLLPQSENIIEVLRQHAADFRFEIKNFPFKPISEKKLTSQLKCQGFVAATQTLSDSDLALFADADTYCIKPVEFGVQMTLSILNGCIGLVKDVKDRHTNCRRRPWFIPQSCRMPYVNSGVMLVARRGFDVLEKFCELSGDERFLYGPFNDQKVINYALNKFFPGRLVLLDKVFNGMPAFFSSDTVIGHMAGGAGKYGTKQLGRKQRHLKKCLALTTKPRIKLNPNES